MDKLNNKSIVSLVAGNDKALEALEASASMVNELVAIVNAEIDRVNETADIVKAWLETYGDEGEIILREVAKSLPFMRVYLPVKASSKSPVKKKLSKDEKTAKAVKSAFAYGKKQGLTKKELLLAMAEDINWVITDVDQ